MTEIERFAGADVNKMLVGNKADMKVKKVVDFATAKVGPFPVPGITLAHHTRFTPLH